MAAAIARREIAETLPVFFDLHTFGGHPVSAAAALANIEIIEREDLVRNAADVGAYMLGLLDELRTHRIVGDVRGIGLLMAIELNLLAVNMNFVAFSRYLGDSAGQVFVFFILTVAAAEAAIGLAILITVFRNYRTINVDDLDTLKG